VIIFIVYAIIPEGMIDAVKNCREECEIFTLTKFNGWAGTN